MIQPERALVTPRVIWPETGDVVPIDEVFHRMEGKPSGAIEIVGSSGSGKTTALQHLAAEAPKDWEIVWADDAKPEDVTLRMRECWVVYTSTSHLAPVTVSSFQLAGWGEDEQIEYLLANHHDKCQPVVIRLCEDNDRWGVGDSPLLWRAVLDEMAEHESIVSAADALRRRLMRDFPEGTTRRWAEEYCFGEFTEQHQHSQPIFRQMQQRCPAESLCLLHALHVQLLLATDFLVRWLGTPRRRTKLLSPKRRLTGFVPLKRSGKDLESAPLFLPFPLVQETAARIADSQPAISRLSEVLSKEDSYLQPMAASILHATSTDWIPDRKPPPCLDSAHLQRAVWPGIDLSDLSINLADLNGSDLSRARLDRVQARATQFRDASLVEACLEKIWARNAYFIRADLTGANLQQAELRYAHLREAVLDEVNAARANFQSTDLRGARLVGANLSGARLSDADIAGADFSSADLERANLHGLDLRDAIFHNTRLAHADLGQCNLEEMRLTGVDFTAARLKGALLSGSVVQGGTLRLANLRGAGLADIQWENADLRTTELHGATFQMGSSRSGLVDSPLASEGTRTGFYTDEFDEQSFQAPEEIRKANLCGADLRGARVDGVDFYLVDLRGAKYDSVQRYHFQKCQAILDDRK